MKSRYIPKTLMLTPEHLREIDEVIKEMKRRGLDMSISSIIRILLDDHLEGFQQKFRLARDGL